MQNAMPTYHEKIHRFGAFESLVGVLTQPETTTDRDNNPAVILLNAGLLHRVGIQRMNVELSRMLAQIGIVSFRVDLYGVGESSSHTGDNSFRQRANDDIRMAMTFLTSRIQVGTFILIGHCAGADNAHQVVVKDPRVIGSIFIDGYGYPTTGFKLRDIGGPSMIAPHRWANYLLKNVINAGTKSKKSLTFMEDYGRYWPFQQDAEKELHQIVSRGVNLLYIYTGGVSIYYNYGGQFYAMFASLRKINEISVHYFKQADHGLTESACRTQILKVIFDWINMKFIGIGK